jgi:hypothetical protein
MNCAGCNYLRQTTYTLKRWCWLAVQYLEELEECPIGRWFGDGRG